MRLEILVVALCAIAISGNREEPSIGSVASVDIDRVAIPQPDRAEQHFSFPEEFIESMFSGIAPVPQQQFTESKEAILAKDVNLVKILVQNSEIRQHVNKSSISHLAAESNFVEFLTDNELKQFYSLTAAVHGSVSFAEVFRLELAANPSAVDNLGYSAFHLTSSERFLDYLQQLPHLRFHINSQIRPKRRQMRTDFDCESTPLHIAIKEKKPISFVDFLLNHNANPDATSRCGQTSLELAVEANVSSTFRLLFDAITPKARNQAFIMALRKRKFQMAKMILLKIRDVCTIEAKMDSNPPLHQVAELADLSELAGILIHKGANTSLFNDAGLTALHVAIKNRNFEVANLLVESETNTGSIDLTTKDTLETALHLSVTSGANELASRLLQKGARTTSYNKAGLTPLLAAIKNSNFDAANMIVRNDASSVNLASKESFDTPLHLLANNDSNSELAEILILKGANLCQNKEGATPLHLAILGSAVRNSLIMANASNFVCIDGQLKDGKNSALHLAAKDAAFFELFKLLLAQKGADALLKNEFGQTPLHIAILYENHQVAKLLLEMKTLPILTSLDNFNRSALHLSVRNSQFDIEMSRLLIKYAESQNLTANMTRQDVLGDTPLHRAVAHQSMAIIRSLLEIETCSTLNANDETPLQLAQHLGYYDLAAKMVESGKCDFADNCGNVTAKPGCGQIPMIANYGSVRTGHACSQSRQITCKQGFQLVGSGEITCTSDRRWEIAGYCQGECGSLPAIPNGKLSGDNSQPAVSSKRTITCEKGFKLRGSAEVTFRSQGKWLVNGSCEEKFFVISERLSYSKAAARCASKAGRPARLAVLKNPNDFKIACSFLGENKQLWVGLKLNPDGEGDQQWQWEDGSYFDESANFWFPGEPNNLEGEEDSVEIAMRPTVGRRGFYPLTLKNVAQNRVP